MVQKMPESTLKQFVLNVLDDQKAIDPVVCDVHKLSSVADYFIICTGRSNRHVLAIADKLVEEAKKSSHEILGVEGKEAGLWVLVDLNGIVVHIMQEEPRNFYELEKLWMAPADNITEVLND